jgi:hypothetical protein
MVNQGSIPRKDIEEAWKSAGQPLVRRSELKGKGKIAGVTYKGPQEISNFIKSEQKKPKEKRTKEKGKDSEKSDWSPRSFEGELPDALVSWANSESTPLHLPRASTEMLTRESFRFLPQSNQSAKNEVKRIPAGSYATFFGRSDQSKTS